MCLLFKIVYFALICIKFADEFLEKVLCGNSIKLSNK